MYKVEVLESLKIGSKLAATLGTTCTWSLCTHDSMMTCTRFQYQGQSDGSKHRDGVTEEYTCMKHLRKNLRTQKENKRTSFQAILHFMAQYRRIRVKSHNNNKHRELTSDNIKPLCYQNKMFIPAKSRSSHDTTSTTLKTVNEDTCHCQSFCDEEKCIDEDSSDFRPELSNATSNKRPINEDCAAETDRNLLGFSGAKRARLTECKRVSFGKVCVRRYDRVFGDHPYCKQGPPVALGWNVQKEESYDLDEYHHGRRDHSSKKHFKLSAQQREKILIKWGYSRKKLREEVKFRHLFANCEKSLTTSAQSYENECENLHRKPSVVSTRTGRPRLWIPETEPKDDRILSLIMGY